MKKIKLSFGWLMSWFDLIVLKIFDPGAIFLTLGLLTYTQGRSGIFFAAAVPALLHEFYFFVATNKFTFGGAFFAAFLLYLLYAYVLYRIALPNRRKVDRISARPFRLVRPEKKKFITLFLIGCLITLYTLAVLSRLITVDAGPVLQQQLGKLAGIGSTGILLAWLLIVLYDLTCVDKKQKSLSSND